MKKRSIAFSKVLASPAMVGILITLGFVAFAVFYYQHEFNQSDKKSSVVEVVKIAHQKSIDFRLRARGPRAVSENIAMLAVDEKSVRNIGRWPWPRDTLGRALDAVAKYDPRVIGFDMVFSEPSANRTQTFVQRLLKDGYIPTDKTPSLNEQLKEFDADQVLSDNLQKWSDKMVVGSFYNVNWDDNGRPNWTRLEDYCQAMTFNRSKVFDRWDNEVSLPIATGELNPNLPYSFDEAYTLQFDQIASDIREQYPESMSLPEKNKMDQEIQQAQLAFCAGFLHPEADPNAAAIEANWPQIAEIEEAVQGFANFAEWRAHFVSSIKKSAIPRVDAWVMNTDKISQGASHTAFFNTDLDSDGVIRSKGLLVNSGSLFMPSLALKTFLVGNNYFVEFAQDSIIDGSYRYVKEVNILNDEGEKVFSVPADLKGNLKIDYAGPQKMFPYVSLGDFLSPGEDLEYEQRVYDKESDDWIVKKFKTTKSSFVKDKTFILGATAVGIFDLRVTPFEENYPGAETHLNLIENLTAQNFLRTSPEEGFYMQLGLLVIGIALSLALTYLGAVSGMLLTALTLSGILLIDRQFLFGEGIVIILVFPILLVSGLYVILTFYKYFTEERGKKELRQTFSKYVSPQIVDEVLKDPENIELGGRKADVTVFFSDVRGFTTISEKLDPRALSDLLNSYLTPMTDLVFQHRGTLDKYMGDAIMAFFGAPISYDDHAHHACRCALEHLEKLKILQGEYEKKGLPMIDVGIGLNTGEVSVGNMGSETVRSYTVMGDAVNLGSRLEGINKQYGTRIIISEFTYERVKEAFLCREIDLVRVKGKVLPVRIYELVAEGIKGHKKEALIHQFNKAYGLYHQKDFHSARNELHQALQLDPEDPVTKLYIQRCEEYLATPPPNDWDGVFIMTSK